MRGHQAGASSQSRGRPPPRGHASQPPRLAPHVKPMPPPKPPVPSGTQSLWHVLFPLASLVPQCGSSLWRSVQLTVAAVRCPGPAAVGVGPQGDLAHGVHV